VSRHTLSFRGYHALSKPEDGAVPQNLEWDAGSDGGAVVVELEIRLGFQRDRKVE
jgi:hypothetical protein